MNKSVRYVVDKIQEYSKIPSLSRNEREFLDCLELDIPIDHYFPTLRDDCTHYTYKHKPARILVTVHTDRIPVRPFKFEILDDKKLKGQLDNVISVALARLLIEKATPVDFLFTTKEEICGSNSQLINAWNHKEYDHVLDLDIDVTVDSSEVEGGAISLRDKDCSADYYLPTVGKLRKLCSDNKIDYITKDGNWLVCQIGCSIREYPKIKGCYVGIPIDNYHSNTEIVNFKCISNVLKLFEAIKGEIDGKTDKNR